MSLYDDPKVQFRTEHCATTSTDDYYSGRGLCRKLAKHFGRTDKRNATVSYDFSVFSSV